MGFGLPWPFKVNMATRQKAHVQGSGVFSNIVLLSTKLGTKLFFRTRGSGEVVCVPFSFPQVGDLGRVRGLLRGSLQALPSQLERLPAGAVESPAQHIAAQFPELHLSISSGRRVTCPLGLWVLSLHKVCLAQGSSEGCFANPARIRCRSPGHPQMIGPAQARARCRMRTYAHRTPGRYY